MLYVNIRHMLPAAAFTVACLGGLQGPPVGGTNPCYLIRWTEGACVANRINGPTLLCPSGSWYQWVVYPTSRQKCVTDFVGNGKTGCNDAGTEESEFHPQRIIYQCINREIIESGWGPHTQITCRHAVYPEDVQDCQRE